MCSLEIANSQEGSSLGRILKTRCANVSWSPGRQGRWPGHWSAACRQPVEQTKQRKQNKIKRKTQEKLNILPKKKCHHQICNSTLRCMFSLSSVTAIWGEYLHLNISFQTAKSQKKHREDEAREVKRDKSNGKLQKVENTTLVCLLTICALLMDLLVRRNPQSEWWCVCVCVLGRWMRLAWVTRKLLMNYNDL